MAENQLQTANKQLNSNYLWPRISCKLQTSLYTECIIQVDEVAKGKLGLALNMNQLSSYTQNRIEVPQPRNKQALFTNIFEESTGCDIPNKKLSTAEFNNTTRNISKITLSQSEHAHWTTISQEHECVILNNQSTPLFHNLFKDPR